MAFDWRRWDRIHRAASRRFDRHGAAGASVRERWDRYDAVMSFARSALERAA